MTRKSRFFVPILAAALALGPMAAAPARAADGNDFAKALLGATALFVIVNGIDNARRGDVRHVRRDAHRRYYRPAPVHRAPRREAYRGRETYWSHAPRHHDRYTPRRAWHRHDRDRHHRHEARRH